MAAKPLHPKARHRCPDDGHRRPRPMRTTPLLAVGALLALNLQTVNAVHAQSGGDVFRISLEEPVQGETHSGVGNLRGWVVANEAIERVRIEIDGAFAFDAPYGGERTDVGAAFPDVPGSDQSGFSLAYNYNELSAGSHTITAIAETESGATLSSEATFTVLRFDSSFISDPQQVDISSAQCVINDQQITLIDALIEGQATDITLRWRTATQGFELIDIR